MVSIDWSKRKDFVAAWWFWSLECQELCLLLDRYNRHPSWPSLINYNTVFIQNCCNCRSFKIDEEKYNNSKKSIDINSRLNNLMDFHSFVNVLIFYYDQGTKGQLFDRMTYYYCHSPDLAAVGFKFNISSMSRYGLDPFSTPPH